MQQMRPISMRMLSMYIWYSIAEDERNTESEQKYNDNVLYYYDQLFTKFVILVSEKAKNLWQILNAISFSFSGCDM